MTRHQISKTIARNVRRVRVDIDITSVTLAGRVGIAASHMSRIESGARLPEIVTLSRVARALGVPLTRLFEGL